MILALRLVRQRDALGRKFLDGLLLPGGEPRFHNRQYRSVLDLLVAPGAAANLLKREKLLRFAKYRQCQLGKPFPDAVRTDDPLFDRVIPLLERARASDDFARQNRRSLCFRSICWFPAQYEVVKSCLASRDHAANR